MRKTKIVATLGPSTSDPIVIEQLIEAGMDVARLNFSHGTTSEHSHMLHTVRRIANEKDRSVACLQDLAGPKIRTGKVIEKGGVPLIAGNRFTITVKDIPGDAENVGTTYKQLPKDVTAGDRIVIDDGRIELSVTGTNEDEVITEVVTGGLLRSNKGINLPNIVVSSPSLTEKDRQDIKTGIDLDIDFIAMSFVQHQNDIETLRKELKSLGRPDIHIIAKIERPQAVDNLSAILSVSDGVMVARGDLGVELAPEMVPAIQKEVIHEANRRGCPVITATQMLESMVENPLPTRAEASDVANAILDGTDALMLSAETASSAHPVEAVNTMARIAEQTEKYMTSSKLTRQVPDFENVDGSDVARAVALAARRAAEELGARYIVAFTESGSTVRLVSHSRPESHIIGFTPSEQVYRRLAMRWGVTPMRGQHFDTTDVMLEAALGFLRTKGLVKQEDLVVTVCGHTTLPGATNMMKVYRF